MHMKTEYRMLPAIAAGIVFALGAATAAEIPLGGTVDDIWKSSEWISFAGAKVADEDCRQRQAAAEGTAYFMKRYANPKQVVKAVWTTSGLGVYEICVNGKRVGDDFLKPGFTHVQKTRRSFTSDVTGLMRLKKGEENVFSAAVSSGWWRDKIVNWAGRRSAFRGVIEFTYADGTKEVKGTAAGDWLATGRGPVTSASIFEGEVYDARIPDPLTDTTAFDGVRPEDCVRNDEFRGEILPSDGAEVCLRTDLAMRPVEAYVCAGVEGAADANGAKPVFGKVKKVRAYAPEETMTVDAGETLVLDFGQNCAAVPFFRFRADEGTTVTALPAEMLNDANGERSRGNDGPAGSVYRENLRMPASGMHAVYTFGAGGQTVEWHPTFSFFGFRYLSVTATGRTSFEFAKSVPVTSITKEMERGRVETGVPAVNRLVSNVYWGQLSNYLSVPTDCPQRNERLGWTADTQVFAEAGAYVADTSRFFHKWMRDLRDSQGPKGGYPGVAPFAQYGNETMRFGWSDAGVIVPYQIWRQFGDVAIIGESWESMEKYMAHVSETKYEYEATKAENGGSQWADWLGYEDLETSRGAAFDRVNGHRVAKRDAVRYWNYLGACYWMWDAQMMAAMAKATGRDAGKYEKMSAEAKAYLKSTFFSSPDGRIDGRFRGMQTPALFALKLGLVEGEAKAQTVESLRKNIRDHGDCLQTGFLGTSILMDTLTENGMSDVAYTLLLQHKNPSWLYSVDQGATTVWERWNSYVKETGFGPVGMNSFNHYAYGAVLAWIYKTAAGIRPGPRGGYNEFELCPRPDARLGWIEASLRTPRGLIRSAWKYADGRCTWKFTVPPGARARVRVNGTDSLYSGGNYELEIKH